MCSTLSRRAVCEEIPLDQLLKNVDYNYNDHDRLNQLNLFDNLTGQ